MNGEVGRAESDPSRESGADPHTGVIIKRENFSRRKWIDRIVDASVAAHEAQLFGVPNQLLGGFAASGLLLMNVSSAVMWWLRRPENVLGAPPPDYKEKLAPGLIVVLVALGVYLHAWCLDGCGAID